MHRHVKLLQSVGVECALKTSVAWLRNRIWCRLRRNLIFHRFVDLSMTTRVRCIVSYGFLRLNLECLRSKKFGTDTYDTGFYVSSLGIANIVIKLSAPAIKVLKPRLLAHTNLRVLYQYQPRIQSLHYLGNSTCTWYLGWII